MTHNNKQNKQTTTKQQVHYKKHKSNDTLNRFKNQFFINEGTAKIML